MNRRDFLTQAAIAIAGMAIDPERLLWMPGQRTIFLPTPTLRGTVQLYVDTSGLVPGSFLSIRDAMASLPVILTSAVNVTVLGSQKVGSQLVAPIEFETTSTEDTVSRRDTIERWDADNASEWVAREFRRMNDTMRGL